MPPSPARADSLLWQELATPVGDLKILASSVGLVRIAFSAVELPAPQPGRRGTNEPIALAQKQIEEYFRGKRRAFSVPLDPDPSSSFRERILATLRSVNYGERWSYGKLAAAAGRPRAVRAAGTACANNPLPIIVPCHRIVRADGSAGNYRGGPAAKEFLLALESGNLKATTEV